MKCANKGNGHHRGRAGSFAFIDGRLEVYIFIIILGTNDVRWLFILLAQSMSGKQLKSHQWMFQKTKYNELVINMWRKFKDL